MYFVGILNEFLALSRLLTKEVLGDVIYGPYGPYVTPHPQSVTQFKQNDEVVRYVGSEPKISSLHCSQTNHSILKVHFFTFESNFKQTQRILRSYFRAFKSSLGEIVFDLESITNTTCIYFFWTGKMTF